MVDRMNLEGAAICEDFPAPETRDILLPNQNEQVSHIAVDIGGSLAKLVYFTLRPNGTEGGRLNFTKFETENVDKCLEFIRKLLAERKANGSGEAGKVVIKATGGGAYLFYEKFQKELGIEIEKEDEMECLIRGLNFFITEIPYEVFTYSENDPMVFEESPNPDSLFPFMLVNIGSGVSIIKVTGYDKFERISGTSLGGGTLWGLLSLLTDAKSFDEMLEMSKHGDNRNVDMLVGDIYGTDYSRIGLKSTVIASTMGKVFRRNIRHNKDSFRGEDIARSLLYMVSNNIGQIAYLNARAHNLKRIYFGGCFIRGHPVTMNTLSYAINFWSKGEIKALFLRHEGYLGAVGAFLKFETARRSSRKSFSFSENFTITQKITSNSLNAYGVLDQTLQRLTIFPMISEEEGKEYHPDTVVLTDPKAQRYWLDTLEKNLEGIVEVALTYHEDGTGQNREEVMKRLDSFKGLFRGHLARLRAQPNMYGSLTVRNILNLREQCLHEIGFPDIFSKVKRTENLSAIETLPSVLEKLDSLPTEEDRLKRMIENILAGNMFDWGSWNVLEMLKAGKLDFATARDKVLYSDRLVNSPALIRRLIEHPPYKKVAIFVDNSGADIVLGIIPFARYLVERGSQVILAANSYPAVNDVTCAELTQMMTSISEIDPILKDAWTHGRLTVFGTGSASPCLDLRRINEDLADECRDVDFVVLEGMGRAIHTNYHARFKCDSLKIAVFKSEAVAAALDARIYDALVWWEQGKAKGVNGTAVQLAAESN
ncbi:uncharacterized protein VTP21DRAFT_4119 [Calcarisporiella thermophila]|uniref:uncharacterized protein n=1 Tax=Calcarisporiella thermophila TaxID=911321 RepID=UPI0037420581